MVWLYHQLKRGTQGCLCVVPQNKKFLNNRLQEHELADLEEVICERGIGLVNEVLYSALIRVFNDINHPGQSDGKAGRVIVVFLRACRFLCW